MDAEQVFGEAIEITDPAQRAAYLDRACHGDEKLRSEVEVLLEANREMGDFLESPPASATLDNSARIDRPGTVIGRYELLELIGEGGMGLVYLAEQKEPVRRKVALKIIKPGMDSRQVIARFEAERQALALLDHPNIAHVFDAGCTEAGRPYFVMEYVRGLSITRYCDDNRLTIEQRLRLFEQVCEGVHHAHQKGIIHRDLKPSNILVSVHGDRGVPKIIDFGIAKAITSPLTDKTFVTFQDQLLGTPEYMSPEQVDLATQDIDTRSDIYSLGVVLYELLAGVLPFESDAFERAGLAEIQQTIREQEPASPSIRLTNLGERAHTIAASRGTQVVPLARRLHRELEWIPLKAMRKDRCRRYKSASEMADDIRNYLNGNPLLAGPETAIYRVQKFVHKHAGSVATAALVALAIVLGLIISTTMYLRAEKALQREAIARVQAENAHEKEVAARTRAEQAEGIGQQQRELAEKKGEAYRRSLYFNQIALADAKYHAADMSSLRKLLEGCPEDLRGYEWHRLHYIQDQSLLTLHGHEGWVLSAAFSRDGKHLASGGGLDSQIKVWDTATGAEVMTLPGHKGGVPSVVFSSDGSHIVSCGRDNTIKIWDVTTGAKLITLEGHEAPVRSVALSPDGKRIVSGSSDKTIRIWNAGNGEELAVLRGGGSSIRSVTFSPDGKRIAGSCDKTIRLWDAETYEELMALGGHEDEVVSTAFSADGKRIVSVDVGNTAKVWNATDGLVLRTIGGHGSWSQSVAISPDGERIVSISSNNNVTVWDVAEGTELMTLCGHEDNILSVVYSADGRRIASTGANGTVRLWDATVDREVVTLRGHRKGVRRIVFSPDGRQIVSGSTDKTIRIWDALNGAEKLTLQGHNGAVHTVAFSPDGQRIISGSDDKTIRIWDTMSGAEEMTLQSGKGGAIWCARFSPDGKRIVSSGYDDTIEVWDAASGAKEMILQAQGSIPSVAFSPDSRRIVSGSSNKTVIVWDAETGAQIMTLRGHSHMVLGVAYSPDGGRIISAGRDRTIKIWDAVDGSEENTLHGHKDAVFSVAFSPDGKRIISGSTDKTIKMWDTETGTELTTLRGHKGGIYSVAFSPDGRRIVSGCDIGDTTINVWESAAPAGGYEPRWTAQAARQVVDELHKEHIPYSKVMEKLKTDKTLDQSVRRVALQIANARLWEDSQEEE